MKVFFVLFKTEIKRLQKENDLTSKHMKHTHIAKMIKAPVTTSDKIAAAFEGIFLSNDEGTFAPEKKITERF